MGALNLRLSELLLTDEDERRQPGETFSPHPEYVPGKLLQELLQEQVQRTPDAVAVVYEEEQLTYGQLNAQANQLARYLRKRGVGPDQRVGISVERSPRMLIGVLGVLKAGGAYVPVDPAYPPERIDYMLKECAPLAILTEGRYGSVCAMPGAVALDREWRAIAQHAEADVDLATTGLTPAHLAYVIYTSGSTGRPKGASVAHLGLTNLLQWYAEEFGFDGHDRTLIVSSFTFDLTQKNLLTPLITGGRIHLAPVPFDPRAIAKQIETEQVTTINLTPSAFYAIIAAAQVGALSSLRHVFLGGEPISWQRITKFRHENPQTVIVNTYGPTECTDVASFHRLPCRGSGTDEPVIPIGCAIANTRLYIVDTALRTVPVGVTGEVCIAGVGVSRGYLNNPQLTASRFLPDPFSTTGPGSRIYRTGDLGRWRADGTIEYLGRNDQQVKIRGYRIELGEIEACLERHDDVKEAVVLVRECTRHAWAEGERVDRAQPDGLEDKRLVTYVTLRQPQGQSTESAVQELRSYLQGLLPQYMVPSAFVVLEHLPLTAHVKLDRGALPAPKADAYCGRRYEPPEGELEQVLAGIWQSLLRVGRVGRSDNFFELGGHSLLIVEMLEQLRCAGLSAEVRSVFASPTLADLARALSRSVVAEQVPPNLIPPGCEALTPAMLPLVALRPEHIAQIVRAVPGGAANIQDIYPLAPLQEGILFHHRVKGKAADPYTRSMLLSLSSRQRLQELVDALQRMIDRHDVLRTAVLWEQLPQPVQVVYARAVLPVEELRLAGDRDELEQLRERLASGEPQLDLRQGPPLRLQVVASRQGTQWYALLQTHHLVCDNQSLEVLLSEVMECLEGRQQLLPPAVAYRNHVGQVLLRNQRQDAEAFFRGKLGDVDEPTAPFGLMDVQGDGNQHESAHQGLPDTLARAIRLQARRLGVSVATVFHAAWALVLAHTSARGDVVFGSVLLGRLQSSAGAQRILGMFINTLPLRLRLQGITTTQLIEQTQRELIELLMHEQASLSVAQRCSGVSGSRPLFSTLLNYRHSLSPGGTAGWSRAAGVSLLASRGGTNYPIVLSVDDQGESFTLQLETDRRIQAQRLVGYVHTALQSLVGALQEAPRTPALWLSILPESERHQVIELFNTTQVSYPREKLIHELFEEQVERTAQAVAVVCSGHSLTYAQLNAKANQLAHYLRERRVGPDQLVGICVERGIEMVVGLLGILKAGGAYVPLDADYPPERLQYLLQDARPGVLLTQERLRSRLPPAAVSTSLICLDSDWSRIAQESSSNPDARAVGLRSDHLAYVIYTSGSTGQPKGVAIEHRNTINLICWARSAMPAELLERTLQSTSLNFDLAVYECFVPLTLGASIHVVENAMQVLRSCLEVTLINTVPSAIRAILAAGQIPPTTRAVNLAGETLKKEVVDLIFQHSGVECVSNLYGPSETTTYSSWISMSRKEGFIATIGRPIANTRIYILDTYRQPVPIGVAGEIYIGGAGVARGYLNLAQLTAERFLQDPFSSDLPTGDFLANRSVTQARLYKTGDLGRWRADGHIEYLGRNDHQVKIRGFRIELGEIEVQLMRHEAIKEAVVIVREAEPPGADGEGAERARSDVLGEKRLVAYVVARQVEGSQGLLSAEALRTYLKPKLPGHMLPSAFVLLEQLPLTANGKLDRRALPAPEPGACSRHQYEPPQGEIETELAGIWQELLQVERVGRHDNFFELGGHSLLIVQMLERLRRTGLSAQLRRVFDSPTLADLGSALTREGLESFQIPPNRIPTGCQQITPDMLPLVQLEVEHIEWIAQNVPGGASNIQDIYPLAPLQEGILFHHLLNPRGADAYARVVLLSLSSQERLQRLLQALQTMIDRHDILRTAVLWEQLPHGVQVVYAQASLPVEELTLQPDRPALEQLEECMQPQRRRLELRQAPLMRVQIAADPHGTQCYALLQTHHLVCDNGSLDILFAEVMACMEAREQSLPPPVPYRNHVAQTLGQARTQEAEAFFRGKLGDVDEPTAPFGLMDVQGDGSQKEWARQELPDTLARGIRLQARRLGVSVATVFHAAWALVLAHTSAQQSVVFGSVLLGRLQGNAGAQRILGMFINTLPLRLRLQGITTTQLIEQTQRELIELLMHEQASLSVAQRCSGVSGSRPLFSTLLNYRHSLGPGGTAGWPQAAGVSLLASRGGTNYPIVLSVDDLEEGFTLQLETDRRIDPQRIVMYVCTAIQSLVEALERAPQTPALSLSILPERERREVIELFNATRTEYPEKRLIHELFEEWVERTPGAIAAVCEGQSLTYAELNGRANQLARYLRGQGVRVGDYIPLLMPRSMQMLIAQLAVLKAGGAYVPLDPNTPVMRQAFIIRDCSANWILTDQAVREFESPSAHWIDCAALDPVTNTLARGNLGLRMPAPPPAYVMYTSGSTGEPKGVIVPHRAVNRLVINTRYVQIDPSDRVAHCSNPAFDASTFEIWGALLNGAAVVIVPQPIVLEAQRFAEVLQGEHVTTMWLTAGLFTQYAAELMEVFSQLRYLLVGGDVVEPATASAVLRNHAPQHLLNGYGPTECTTFSATYPIETMEDARSIPIGRPVSNTRIYILDGRLQPVPIGATGEIHIGGAGVAQGYLNRPELTAERFVADPFSAEPQARMYKSGDLGRWRPDGNIEYLGRNDTQVKIRGFRIELGEIEAQLLQYPQVKEAVVLARDDETGERRLVAYVVFQAAASVLENASGVEALRARLKATLPDYMVPSAFVMLESFPLTANGKLDRRALPAPERSAYGSGSYAAPQGEIEEILAGVWQGLLRQERVGRQDNFFELGGHSLLIVQMLERLRRVGLSAEVRRVFESPTLAELASVLMSESAGQLEVLPNLIPPGCESITPSMLPLVELEAGHIERIVQAVPGGAANIQDIYPLIPLQEGLLFHHLLNDQGGDAYARAMLLSLSSREGLAAFVRALQEVIDRHDILRTAVLWEQLPRPLQVVRRQATLVVEEIGLDPDCDPLEQLKERMSPALQRLDLRQAPLMRLQVAADSRQRHWYALVQTHHLVCDNQSIAILLSEVIAHFQGRANEIPPPVAYRNHVAQVLARARTHDAEAFFRDKLGDIQEPTTPFGVLDVHGDGSRTEEARETLEVDLARRIRLQARRLSVSAATLFHAAWGLIVAATSGRDDVVYGTVLLGRLQGSAGAQRILGMFINTLPLRLRLREVTAKGLVEQTQRELVQLLTHEQASLAVAQRCSGIVGSAPLFSALLNYRHSVPDAEVKWPDSEEVKLLKIQGGTNYPIVVSVDDSGEEFVLTAQTEQPIDPRRMVAYVRAAMQSLLEALERAPRTPALWLSILPESERHQVIELFNTTQVSYPREKLIHELFEEQVERTAQAVAVVCSGHSLTYAQLNAKANQLAHYLRERRVGPDQLVGICVERGIEMVVGLLGILKAGGAYVPLDADYPPERLQYLLQDARPGVLLTQERLRSRLPPAAVSTSLICLDSDWSRIAQESSSNPDARAVGLRSDHLAYVIYTSGSTGQPKGVAIEHRNTINLICWARSAMPAELLERTLQSTSLNFDLAVYECFVPLTLGASIHVVENAMQVLRSCLEVTLINTVPSAIRAILAAGQIPPTTRAVNLAGETLKKEVVDLIFQHSGVECVSNLYGPSETTTYSSWISMSRKEGFIATIGRPIANTRIYILDTYRQPVPIGVAGEIYIGGAGVARGYLNLAQLTAERFLQDPFSSDLPTGDFLANRSVTQARLYKTGDLGRWRADGHIEYLGRNDHQVKIRGFRIELGEIEVQLMRHEAIKEAVVIVREAEPPGADGEGAERARSDVLGEKRLVAYVVARQVEGSQGLLSAEALRTYLKPKLPGHMLPSAFVLLEQLPLTANGKLDRRALPAPEPGACSRHQYEPPQGEIETELAGIWQELLQVERVGRHDNFFELGGHSLLTVQLLSKISQSVNRVPKVADIYRNPTLQQLARYIEDGGAADGFVELSREATIGLDTNTLAARRPYIPARTILLTGCTGFVGRFLLAQLLLDTSAVVYCLVRAPSVPQARARLEGILEKWDLSRADLAHRIIAVPGNLCRSRLGLDDATYEMLSTTIDCIYHCGASVHHLETYAMAKPANVVATSDLLRLATLGRSKSINYISTLSVFAAAAGTTGRVVDESTPIDGERHPTSSGYAASKWVAEKILMRAAERGIPCNIFRLGLVWADSQQGRYDELQREYRLIKSCLLAGVGIQNYRYDSAPLPVDYVARALVALASRHPDGGGVFHLTSSRRKVEKLFERCNLVAGTSLQLVTFRDWIGELKRLHESGRSLPVMPLIDSLFTRSGSRDTTAQELHADTEALHLHHACVQTDRCLQDLGLEPPAFSDDLLRRCVTGMLARDEDLRRAI